MAARCCLTVGAEENLVGIRPPAAVARPLPPIQLGPDEPPAAAQGETTPFRSFLRNAATVS